MIHDIDSLPFLPLGGKYSPPAIDARPVSYWKYEAAILALRKHEAALAEVTEELRRLNALLAART